MVYRFCYLSTEPRGFNIKFSYISFLIENIRYASAYRNISVRDGSMLLTSSKLNLFILSLICKQDIITIIDLANVLTILFTTFA